MNHAVLLAFAVVLAGCTTGAVDGTDADGDGLEDKLERSGWSSQVVEFMDRRVEVEFASDPTKVDTDGDGLTDRDEFFIRTNPQLKDTDGDGLTDCQESRHTNATECEAPGFDSAENGDGGYATDPRKADSDPGPSFYKSAQPWDDQAGDAPEFRFGDGLSDGMEVMGYWVEQMDRRVFVRSDPRQVDTDGDGLEDAEEAYMFASDPVVADTDGDGCADGMDVLPSKDTGYDLGLQSLALAGNGGERDIVLTVLFFDRVDYVSARVDGGSPHAFSPGEVSRTAQEACNTSPRLPWVRVQIIAYDQAADTHLDLASENGFGDGLTAEVWWNPTTGALAQSSGGPDRSSEGALHMTGQDGSLGLHPQA